MSGRLVLATLLAGSRAAASADQDWPSYNRSLQSDRYVAASRLYQGKDSTISSAQLS